LKIKKKSIFADNSKTGKE